MDVEGVLVGHEAAIVEGREVGAAAEGHRLVLARPRVVLERDAFRYETVSDHGCSHKNNIINIHVVKQSIVNNKVESYKLRSHYFGKVFLLVYHKYSI